MNSLLNLDYSTNCWRFFVSSLKMFCFAFRLKFDESLLFIPCKEVPYEVSVLCRSIWRVTWIFMQRRLDLLLWKPQTICDPHTASAAPSSWMRFLIMCSRVENKRVLNPYHVSVYPSQLKILISCVGLFIERSLCQVSVCWRTQRHSETTPTRKRLHSSLRDTFRSLFWISSTKTSTELDEGKVFIIALTVALLSVEEICWRKI